MDCPAAGAPFGFAAALAKAALAKARLREPNRTEPNPSGPLADRSFYDLSRDANEPC